AGRDMAIGTIATEQGRIRGWLTPDGTVNYVSLLASAESEDQENPTPAPAEKPAGPKQAQPWSIAVSKIQMDGYGIAFEDRSLTPPAQIAVDDLRVAVKDVRMPFAKPMDVSAGLMLNKTGRIEVSGSVGLNPMRAAVNLNLSRIGLRPFQPYANRFVKAATVGGELHADGAVKYAAKQADEPLLAYDGKVSITDFELGDRASDKPPLTWASLSLKGMAVRLDPTAIKIGEIEWRKPSIQVVVDRNGTLNFSRFAGGSNNSGEPAAAPKPTATPPEPDAKKPKPAGKEMITPIAVDTVKLVNMTTTFIDESIDPPVITGIQELGGTIKGLSSKEIARAKVSLTGKVDKIAPIKIHGQINPLSEDAYTDLKVTFDNMNLIAASPYAGKYAGYPITKGKLYLDLMYQVSKKQLHAENKVVIDQFTFGEKTDSPDATSLPVRLAVALLKDRHGKIEVDLPIRGDLNEPDFKYGRVLLDTLGNLITKVAASPFAAIGNLVGGDGEELQYVAFDPGRADLTDADRSKLRSLEKALNDRPALRLEVMGRADPKLDGHAIAKQKVEDAVLARHEKTNRKASQTPPSEARRLELLNELYIQEFGRQPMKREETAGGKSVERVMSDEEILDELSHKQEVTEVELRQLAQNRAREIRKFLVGESQADQGQPDSQRQQDSHGEPEGERTAQADQGEQANPTGQEKGENASNQDSPMSEDRVFLLEVELGGASGGQVRSQLNLSGA
ncbi:MAG TPA: DUF748 domain-containing protein, partial [Nitrospiraceae bacterium]|nr:DUF748 domain-containing protein [Nitrospiraceae bacterium]